MAPIKVQKLENEENWNHFINDKDTKIQQTIQWRTVITNTYTNCKPEYYVAIKENKIIGIFPFFMIKSKIFDNRLISLPFIDTCGFLFKDDNALKYIIEKIKDEHQNTKLEIRLNTFLKNFNKTEKILLKQGFKETKEKKQAIIQLKPEEEMWNKFHKHTRNDIRKAEKSDLTIKIIDDEKELLKFYKLYTHNMKAFGTPPHSYKFFQNMMELMKCNFYGLNCYKDDKIIGSLILLHHKTQGYIAFNASDNKYLQYRPNDLLYWQTIKWSIKNKIQYLDLGQVEINASEGSHALGLQRFKDKWLGDLYDRIYFNYPNNEGISKKDKYKKLRKLWSMLPQFIIKRIGPKICSELGI
jgi:hypothetical protein